MKPARFNSQSTHANACRAFSLVELLVVIAIIALLLAILLPVLSMIRKSARSTACLANLHQWGASYQMYLNGNRGRSFLNRQALTDPAWYEVLKPYNGDVHRTLLCPEATEPGNMIGSDVKAWGPSRAYDTPGPQWKLRDTFVGSYGFNGWLWRLSAAESATAVPEYRRYMIELPALHPDRIPVFADCIDEWASPRDTDTPPYNLHDPLPRSDVTPPTPPPPPGPVGMMSHFCIDRHRRAVNVVFLDGHAANIPLADLWQQQWNASFTPRQVVIPP